MTKVDVAPKLAWTEEAKFQFLLRVIAQLQRNGQTIKWDEIKIPGRTPKSLQHQWANIKAQVAELEDGNGQPGMPTKAKGKAAGFKRKAEALATPEATPEKKRTPLARAIPVKKEEADEED